MRATSDRFERRLDAAAARVAEVGAAGLVVGPSPDLAYLCGYDPMPLERLTALVIVPERRPVLIVPLLERPLAASGAAGVIVDLVGWRDTEDPYAIVEHLLPPGPVRLGDRIWGSHVLELQSAVKDRAWTSAADVVGWLRARKDPEELDALRRAAAAADRCFDDLRSSALIGRQEVEVADELAVLLVAHGHERAEFTIVASGPNAASPHHEPTGRLLRSGDALVLDFGGSLDGYYSDTTRTLALGEPTSELRTVHEIVRRAQAAATEAIRPGVAIATVDAAARGVIDAAGYGEHFIHRTGHGIGREVHEPPYAAGDDRTVLEPGMTFSVEPGIYLDGRLGVRIEDIVAVTEDGVESLNRSPRELLVAE